MAGVEAQILLAHKAKAATPFRRKNRLAGAVVRHTQFLMALALIEYLATTLTAGQQPPPQTTTRANPAELRAEGLVAAEEESRLSKPPMGLTFLMVEMALSLSTFTPQP
jgi:hypothetical protein